ncbi:hypothetical protein J7M28_09665 [bacterium]|nr:hypothetical protein [bacterium]
MASRCSSILAAFSGQLLKAYLATVYIQCFRELVWSEIFLEVPTGENGRCWPCFAEDAPRRVWCHTLTRADARDPVFLLLDTGIEKYDGIKEAVEQC